MSEREKKIVEDILTSVGLEHVARPDKNPPEETGGSPTKPSAKKPMVH